MSTFEPGGPDQGRPEQYPSAPQYGQNAPAYSGGYGEQTGPTGPAPATVIRATLLMFLQAALGLVGLIFSFADADGLKDSIRDSDSSLTPDQVDSAYTLSLAVAVVIGLIFAAAYVLLAIQVRKGKNWARITTLVIAGISILFGLLGLAASAPALSRVLGIVGLLINIAIVVLLVLKPSSEFFKRRQLR